jgi:hypothetical protein
MSLKTGDRVMDSTGKAGKVSQVFRKARRVLIVWDGGMAESLSYAQAELLKWL